MGMSDAFGAWVQEIETSILQAVEKRLESLLGVQPQADKEAMCASIGSALQTAKKAEDDVDALKGVVAALTDKVVALTEEVRVLRSRQEIPMDPTTTNLTSASNAG